MRISTYMPRTVNIMLKLISLELAYKFALRFGALIVLTILITGCATFENKGEKFPFTIKVIEKKSPSPSIIVSHGGACRLSQDEMWGAKFVEWGYNVVIVDHCTARRISGHVDIDPPLLAPEDRVNDYIAIAEWIKLQTWHSGKVAVFGISRGGEAVLRASNNLFNRVRRGSEGLAELDVYVALYPACTAFPEAPRGPLLVLHGEEDNLALFSFCDYASKKHPNLTIRTYPNTHHGFDVFGVSDIVGRNNRGNFIARRYNAESAVKAEVEVREFLQRTMR